MKMQKILLMVINLSVYLFVGCSPVLIKIVGISKPKKVTKQDIIEYANRIDIDSSISYVIDTSYFNYIQTLFSSDKKLIENLLQPLQVRVYKNVDTLVTIHINCQVTGFPNLKWNRYGQFDSLPPKYSISIDSVILFSEEVKYFHILGHFEKNIEQFSLSSYNIVVFWTIFMGRQSRILVKEMKKYADKYKHENINIIYVNVDPLYYNI